MQISKIKVILNYLSNEIVMILTFSPLDYHIVSSYNNFIGSPYDNVVMSRNMISRILVKIE